MSLPCLTFYWCPTECRLPVRKLLRIQSLINPSASFANGTHPIPVALLQDPSTPTLLLSGHIVHMPVLLSGSLGHPHSKAQYSMKQTSEMGGEFLLYATFCSPVWQLLSYILYREVYKPTSSPSCMLLRNTDSNTSCHLVNKCSINNCWMNKWKLSWDFY